MNKPTMPRFKAKNLGIANKGFPVVCVGGSAGGLDAYIRTWTPAYEQDRFAF